jgi:hemolysin D
MLEGELISVGADAVPSGADQKQDQGGAATGTAPGYKGVVQLRNQALSGGMGRYPINAGMQLTAEIIEGNRTVMQYLLSPVKRTANEAGRER